MMERQDHRDRSLFDFAPLAGQYDQWYATPAGRAHDRAQKRDVRRLLPRASAGQALLDIGCGTGHWSAFFAEMGYRVTGVDIAETMIEVARSAVPQCTFQVADACRLPFDDGTFDVAAAMATLAFVPDAAAAVGEMARCTTTGGRLLVGALNRLAPLNQHRLARRKEPYASGQLLSPAEVKCLLSPYGRVRMIASQRSSPHRPRPLPKRIVERLAAL